MGVNATPRQGRAEITRQRTAAGAARPYGTARVSLTRDHPRPIAVQWKCAGIILAGAGHSDRGGRLRALLRHPTRADGLLAEPSTVMLPHKPWAFPLGGYPPPPNGSAIPKLKR